MSEYITADNLDKVIEENKKIRNEIDSLQRDFFTNHNKSRILGEDKLAFETLKKSHTFLQIPIPDEYYGGAIIVRGNIKIPLINTSQPRVYQYFVAWHEVYHLLYDDNLTKGNHVVKVEEMELNERKADYFAAKMLLGDVYKYYYSLEEDNFISKIARCIDVFKAPYKAVLIELYEQAALYSDLELKEVVKISFDNKRNNLVDIFMKLELDTDLLKPSNIISFGNLTRKMESLTKKEMDVKYHQANLDFLNVIKRTIKEELKYENY